MQSHAPLPPTLTPGVQVINAELELRRQLRHSQFARAFVRKEEPQEEDATNDVAVLGSWRWRHSLRDQLHSNARAVTARVRVGVKGTTPLDPRKQIPRSVVVSRPDVRVKGDVRVIDEAPPPSDRCVMIHNKLIGLYSV
jgi:hypothetical protein